MACVLPIFGKPPFFELVCVLTAAEKSLNLVFAIHENSIHMKYKKEVYSRRCKAVLLFHETHEIVK